ncbi:Flp family type IVb pilin [Vibrio paucivorans]
MFNAMAFKKMTKNIVADEEGVTAIEYGLIAIAMAALLSVVMASDGGFVTALEDAFQAIADMLNDFSAGIGAGGGK